MISLLLFASFAYFTFFVPLGDKTLYRHMQDISDTREAKALGNGIKDKALDVKNEVVQHVPELDQTSDRTDKNSADKKEASAKSSSKVVKSGSKNDNSEKETISSSDKNALAKLLKSKL